MSNVLMVVLVYLAVVVFVGAFIAFGMDSDGEQDLKIDE